MMDMQFFLILILAFYGSGFLLPIVWRTPRAFMVSLWLALSGSVVGMVVSGALWFNISPMPGGVVFSLDLWRGIAQGFPGTDMPSLQLEFQFDHLSAFFVFLVTAFSTIVGVYSFGALEARHYQKYRLRIASGFNLFVWATTMVFLAHDIFSLLLTLEIASLALGYLALYKHTLYQEEESTYPIGDEKQKTARIASQIYLVVSHTSTVFLLIALLILAINAGSVGFDIISQQKTQLSSVVSTLVFLLAMAGLGIRAGLTPAHFWPPLVHPAAPITLHALFTGVAIKAAIYLMYRFFFQFLQPQAWWGYLFLLIAATTALVNVWYAISSHDLKTALAYHSLENIGIICVGIGLGMIFWRESSYIAALGLVASLYHLLNHAVFKGLLFFATGAIDNLTHQVVEFDRLGGLIKRYGFTSTMFLLGSFAIAGFPPFNGFISEWLTLQALFKSLIAQGNTFFIGLGINLLSLTFLVTSFALTAFCFCKMAGITLLGLPRLPESEREHWELQDVPWTMKSMMALMAALCLLLGVIPRLIVSALGNALESIGIQGTALSDNLTFLSSKADMASANLPIAAILGLVLALLAIPLLINFRRPVVHRTVAWNCGAPIDKPPIHQFTSSAASFLLRDLFSVNTLNRKFGSVPDYIPAHFSLSGSAKYPQEILEFFRVGYNLVIDRLLGTSENFGGWLQNRDIRRYLWYIFLANLAALLAFILIKVSGGK